MSGSEHVKNILRIMLKDSGKMLLDLFHCSTLGTQKQLLECLLPKTDKGRLGEDHKLEKRKKGGKKEEDPDESSRPLCG